ncbi:hypothetical protein ABT352_23085 [Streptosporangium sp. NPDC000563]|uniref:hypothetical protein n=1 Tax=Streptosporangium sp. NPDC000563 TaxID=3154366 RepID=UPI00332F31F1
MPVEPQPCPPGGGDSDAPPSCCAPAIATQALCLPDGTPILLVVRSGCVECGTTPADPQATGWINPQTGVFTPGGSPAEAGPCDSGCATVTTVQLCDLLPDGDCQTFLRHLVRDCDGTVTSSVDTTLDGVTPYTVTGTAGNCAACSAGCVETICVQRCDDTDGDGQADTTYSELWCVHADGSAELVLTYQADPSTPYAPIAPVECVYGCPETETVTLCDASGPFLRRYTFLTGQASYEDVALDGQTPHVVTGAVGLCPAVSDCEAPTTPAATLGLCLADGTPIAVLVTRDCDGTVTQDGWLNLTTGTYSAGDPPAGTMACGNPRSITTAGTFCDVDPVTGDVLGLVLVEYTYGSDGAVAAVRLVDATTGQTYTPQGEVTTCPAGVAQPERDLVQLCDTADDGTVTAFLRDYARDENGQITGHTDYLLDGTPYTPTGAVGRCVDQCHDCETVVLCDTDASPPATIAGTAASGTLPNGVTYAVTAPNAFPPTRQGDGAAWWGTALFPNPVVPTTVWTFDRPVNVKFSVIMNWSPATGAGENQVQLPAGAVPVSLPAGYTYDWATSILRADNSLTACTVTTPTRAASARFRLTGVTSFSARYLGTRAVNVDCRVFGHWVFGALDVSLGAEFARTVCRDCAGDVVSTTDTLLDGSTPYTPTGLVGVCQPAPEETAGPVEPDTEVVQLCDTAPDGASTPFLRALTFPAGGGTPTVADTALDGVTPYTPAGTVGVCQPTEPEPEPCRNTSTLLVCDLPTGGTPTPTVTGTDPNAYVGGPPTVPVPGGVPALWGGGSVTIGPDPAPGPHPAGVVRTVAATVQAARPDCDTGTAHVTLSVDVAQLGPTAACGPTGWLMLFNGTTQVTHHAPPNNAPVGWAGTLTVEADVPAADLAAGQIAAVLGFDTYDSCDGVTARQTSWQLSAFTAETTYDQTGCATQVLANVVTDCESGTVESVTYTTMDGTPYMPTGSIGQCTAAGGGECCPSPEPCGDTEVVQLCDLTYDPQAPVPTPASAFTLTGNVVAANGGTTLWFAQANQVANGVAELTVGGLLPAVLYEFSFASAWIGAGAPDPASNNAVYRLDVLDGATVLATRTRNVSNGSNVFPGGVLTEDLPPLAFIAPATGAVTIRFTDQTTGGPVNDRDLFLMPLEVRTAALTLTRTPFLRRFTFDCDGGLTSTQDLGLDSVTPYTLQGVEGGCGGDGGGGAAPGPDTEVIRLCDVASDGSSTPFLRQLTYEPGADTPTVVDTALDALTPYAPAGQVGDCGGCPQHLLEECRWDDTDGDGLGDVTYVELLQVDGCSGAISSLGTYTDDLTAPYTPVAPTTECPVKGAPPVTGVQARRVELAAGASWDASVVPRLQSVTAVAHGGSGVVVTADGASTLHAGEAATWSVGRNADVLLAGPLTISAGAGAGTVTVTWTQGVTL